MASTRYVAGPMDTGRLARAVLEVVGGAAVLWVWTWMRGSGNSSLPWPLLVAGAVMVCWSLVRTVLRRHQLRALVVDDHGVQLRRVVVPWPDVREVTVLRHGPQGTGGGRPPEVGLVLRTDAGLPTGLTALVRDPDPDVIPAPLRLSTAGWRLDVDRLGAAVRLHGGGVPLVERWGSARRVLA